MERDDGMNRLEIVGIHHVLSYVCGFNLDRDGDRIEIRALRTDEPCGWVDPSERRVHLKTDGLDRYADTWTDFGGVNVPARLEEYDVEVVWSEDAPQTRYDARGDSFRMWEHARAVKAISARMEASQAEHTEDVRSAAERLIELAESLYASA